MLVINFFPVFTAEAKGNTVEEPSISAVVLNNVSA